MNTYDVENMDVSKGMGGVWWMLLIFSFLHIVAKQIVGFVFSFNSKVTPFIINNNTIIQYKESHENI